MGNYHPATIRGSGLKAWIDRRADNHPMHWGYDDFVYLLKQGLNLTALAQAMNMKTTEAIKEWIAVYNEES